MARRYDTNGMNSRKSVTDRQKRGLAVAVVFFAIVIVFTIARQSLSGGKYEDTVKNASPVGIGDSGETYGEAFERYFENGNWAVFQQQDKSYIVQFRGICTYQGSRKSALIQFMVGDIPSSSGENASATASSASSSEVSSEALSTSGTPAENVQITVSSVESTADVHIIYVGLNEEVLSSSEQKKFLKEVFK